MVMDVLTESGLMATMNTSRPAVVVSTGHCGSSSLASILHNTFGYCMGEKFHDWDEDGRDGSVCMYEDWVMAIVVSRAKGDRELFRKLFTEFVDEKVSDGRKWGFKSSGWILYGDIMLDILPDPFIISIERDMATKNNGVDYLYSEARKIRELLSGREYLPMYLSDIVFDVAEEKIANYLEGVDG